MVSKTILVGNVGQDPDVRTLESGKKVANFSLATSETYKDKQSGNKITDTEWHRCVIYGGLAEVIEKYVKKGSKLYLEGRNKTRSYDKDGQTFYTTEVICKEMTMLGSKEDNNSN